MATQALVAVNTSLTTVEKYLDATQLEFGLIAVTITQITMLGASIQHGIDTLDNVTKILSDLLELASKLGRLVPEVGPVIARVASTIERTHIVEDVRKILDKMRKADDKIQNGVARKIRNVTDIVVTQEQKLRDKIPGWITQLNGFVFWARVCDTLFGVVTLLDSALGAKLKDQFNHATMDIIQPLKDIEKLITSVEDFVQGTWHQVIGELNTTINTLEPGLEQLKLLSDEIEGFFTFLNPFADLQIHAVTEVVETVENVISDIWGWFCRTFTVFSYINKVVNKLGEVINSVTEYVLDKLGLNAAIDTFIHFLGEVTGLGALDRAFRQEFLDSFDKLATGIEGLVDIGEIEKSIDQFAHNLENYSIHPVESLLSAIYSSKGLINSTLFPPSERGHDLGDPSSDGNKRRSDPFSRTQQTSWHRFGVNSQNINFSKRDNLDSSGPNSSQAQIQNVRDIQKAIDLLCATGTRQLDNIEVTGNNLIRRQTSSSLAGIPPAKPPNLSLASYKNQSLSVIIRLAHPPVLQDLRGSSNVTPEATNAPWLGASSGPNLAKEATGSSSAALKDFETRYQALNMEIGNLQMQLDHLQAPFQQADIKFGKNVSEAIDFADHLANLFSAFEPRLQAIKDALQTPLAYKGVLSSGLTSVTNSTDLHGHLSSLVNTLEQVENTVLVLSRDGEQVTKDVMALSTTYRQTCQALSQPRLLGNITNAIGPKYGNLVTLLTLSRQWLLSVDRAFGVIKLIADEVYQNRSMFTGDTASIFAQLDNELITYNSIVNGTTSNINLVSTAVANISPEINSIQAGFDNFVSAATNISQQCGSIELKLIAMDQVRSLGANITSIMLPFAGLFSSLNKSAAAEPLAMLSSGLGNLSDSFQSALGRLSDTSTVGMQEILEYYLTLNDTRTEIADLDKALRLIATDSSMLQDQTTKLLQIVKPSDSQVVFSFPIEQGPANSAIAPLLMINPFPSGYAAQNSLFNIVSLAQQLKYPDNSTIFGSPMSSMANYSTSTQSVQAFYLQAAARLWDNVEPSYNSSNFVWWYATMQSLDQLVQGIIAPSFDFPLAQAWKKTFNQINSKISTGINQYQAAFSAPLREPLQKRINLLLRGNIRIEGTQGAGGGDFLKTLPPPPLGLLQGNFSLLPTSSRPKTLPLNANLTLSSAFKAKGNGSIPDSLAAVLAQQTQFETVAFELRQVLTTIGGSGGGNGTAAIAAGGLLFSPQACLDSLDALHDDFNLAVARQFLAITLDDSTTRQFVAQAGSGALLP